MSAIHAMAALNDRRHYVYAMLCQDGDGPGYVKFGRSAKIGQRLSQLRAACPIPARYFAVAMVSGYDAAIKTERALHRAFAERRVTGEWYRFDFASDEDRGEFNAGCRCVFQRWRVLGGWTKVSIAALDAYNRQRSAAFLQSKKGRRADFSRRMIAFQ